MNINGRFTKVNDNPVVVGFIGNVRAENLTAEQVKHIKGFYNVNPDAAYRIIDNYPVKVNQSIYNNFIIFE